MNNVSNASRTVARFGIFFAVIFVAFMLDKLISSWFAVINFAVLSLPTAFSLILMSRNWKEAILTGGLLGLASLISAVLVPTALTPFFLLPWNSLLPRMVVSIAVFGAFLLVHRIVKAKSEKVRYGVAGIVGGIVGATVNTATVMLMLSLFPEELIEAQSGGYFALISMVLATNYVPEVITAATLTPVLVISLTKALKTTPCGIKRLES